MSEVNKISNVENKNTYSINSGKKSSEYSSDFSSYLGETKSLDDIFEQASDKYNVPVNLLKAIGKAESNFNAKAVSRCGAQGVMQLMPATAKSLGVTDSFDAEQNIMGGAKYIAGLLKKYDGDSRLALAAYNAGSGNVAKYGGIPPFEETQNYVKKVMNYMGKGVDTEGAYVSTGTANGKNGTNKIIPPVAAAPVQKNLSFLLTNDADGTSSELEDLNSLFSYEDYMKFMELFLNDDKDEDNKNEKENYTTRDINYNVPIMNLLNNQNGI
ncbi:MAG: hypothetical protein K0S01_1035 [Herbinix sp.]|jgi:hypothetical protein|nr:hypothetical protein [Herbinix sp.]